MKKIITTIAALLALSMAFVACNKDSPDVTGGDDGVEPYVLTLEDLGTGWSSSYDAETQTIEWSGAYGGRGWWLGGFDASDYSTVEVVLSNVTGDDPWVQLVIQYDDGSKDGVNEQKDGLASNGSITLTKELNSELKSNVKQIYIQGKAAGNTAKVVSGKLK